MTPVFTLYRLANPGDTASCRALWMHNTNLFGKVQKLGWPTVIAERNNVILGFMSTLTDTELITAGPLILRKNASPIIALRLCEAYENVLRIAKVTTYFFHIDTDNEHWLGLIKRLGMEPFESNERGHWFRRELNGRQ